MERLLRAILMECGVSQRLVFRQDRPRKLERLRVMNRNEMIADCIGIIACTAVERNPRHDFEPSAKQVVDRFNRRHPVGTLIRYWPLARGFGFPVKTRTRTRVYLLGGHTPVVWVDDRADCIALSHADVVEIPNQES